MSAFLLGRILTISVLSALPLGGTLSQPLVPPAVSGKHGFEQEPRGLGKAARARYGEKVAQVLQVHGRSTQCAVLAGLGGFH